MKLNRAKNLVKEFRKLNFEYGGKISQDRIDTMCAQMVLDFYDNSDKYE